MAKKQSKPNVPKERVDQLTELLERDELSTISCDEAVALAEHLGVLRLPELLRRLAGLVTEKKAVKAVNKALFRLRQLGLVDTSQKVRTGGIRLTKGKADELDALLIGVGSDGQRTLIFAHPAADTLRLVSVTFDGPTGLKELWSRPTTRKDYRKTLAEVLSVETKSPYEEPVVVAPEMVERKLWWLQQQLRAGRIGPQVEREVVSELRFPSQKPLHPIQSLPLDEAEKLSHEALLGEVALWVVLLDFPSVVELTKQLGDMKDSPLVLSDSIENSRRLESLDQIIDKAIDSWTVSGTTELFLDLAYRVALLGHQNEARTLYDVVSSPDADRRRRCILELLRVLYDAATGQPTPDGEGDDIENSTEGGIILP